MHGHLVPPSLLPFSCLLHLILVGSTGIMLISRPLCEMLYAQNKTWSLSVDCVNKYAFNGSFWKGGSGIPWRLIHLTPLVFLSTMYSFSIH